MGQVARVIGCTEGRAAEAALASGPAVVFPPSLLDHGMAHLTFSSGPPIQAVLPVVAVHSTVSLAEIVIPPSQGSPVGLACGAVRQAFNEPARGPDAGRQPGSGGARDRRAGDRAGNRDRIGTELLAVAIGDPIVTVALAATALIAVDGRDDLMTLAAVGPRQRPTPPGHGPDQGDRLVGAVSGTFAAVVPGIGLVWRIRRIPAK
jgi:hypothetical protein